LQDLRLRAIVALPPEGNAMTKLDDFLMFCCVSAFFAGVVIAVTTLPV
jgi:hypothetical protein